MERELKLHVPATAAKALKKALIKAGAMPIALHARYFDTAQRELATAGVALRVRREGEQWVQTLKAPGTDTLSKVELNHPLPTGSFDLSVYQPLHPALEHLRAPLALRYETNIDRLVMRLATDESVIEIAYDEGQVCAGSLGLPVREIEFELVSGNMGALFAVGAKWLQKYGLIIDLRSKAERGDLLARAVHRLQSADETADDKPLAHRLFKPRHAQPVALSPRCSPEQAFLACSTECLLQIVRNAAFAAGVDTSEVGKTLHAEYIHQLRVGLRRLRTCSKLFNGWVSTKDAEIAPILRKSFSKLGEVRDTDVIRQAILPALKQSGMPACDLPRVESVRKEKGSSIAGNPEFQAALLMRLGRLIALGDRQQETADPAARQPAVAPVFAADVLNRLSGWAHEIAAAGAKFETLSIKRQHALRNKIKTLRYSIDLTESILPGEKAAAARKTLVLAQDVLGDLNDFYVADDAFTSIVKQQPQAWFAVGWLRAMQTRKKQQAQAVLQSLEPGYSPTTALANSRATKGCKSSSPSPTPIQ